MKSQKAMLRDSSFIHYWFDYKVHLMVDVAVDCGNYILWRCLAGPMFSRRVNCRRRVEQINTRQDPKSLLQKRGMKAV